MRITVPSSLTNVVCAQTKITLIKHNNLAYSGYAIDDLIAQGISYEAVLYLLWHQGLPNQQQLQNLKHELYQGMHLTPSFINELHQLCHNHPTAHPMALLRTAVSMFTPGDQMNQFEAQNAWLQGHMLKTVTTIIAFLQQRTPLAAKPELNVAQNFYYLLTGALPTLEQTQIMNRVLVLHADHDLNASTFTSRVVASTESDTVSCLTAAVCALKGPLHGGANEAVFEMLSELKQAVTDTETTVADFIQLKLNRKEKIPGFGHRIYKNGDPRATYLKQSAEKITKLNHQRVWFELSEQVCQVVADRLNLKPNVDFYTATIYHCLGLPANVFTLLFAVCRTGGWLAHIHEQRTVHKLIRPSSEYIGKRNQVIKPTFKPGEFDAKAVIIRNAKNKQQGA